MKHNIYLAIFMLVFFACEENYIDEVMLQEDTSALLKASGCWNGNIDWNLSTIRITKGSTQERIDALTFGGLVYYFYKGESGNSIFYSRGTAGGSFTEYKVPGEESKESPAAAVYNNRLYIAFRGESSERLYIKYMTSSGTWSSHFTVGDEYTEVSPALVSYNSYLYLIFKGRTGSLQNRMRVIKINSAHQVVERYWIPTNNLTGRSPYAVNSNGKMYLVYIGVSGNLWHTYYISGQTWANPVKIQDIAFDFWGGQWGNTFNYVTAGSLACRTYGICGINTSPGLNQIIVSWDLSDQNVITNVYFNGNSHTIIPLSPFINIADYVYAYYPNHNNDIVEIRGTLRY